MCKQCDCVDPDQTAPTEQSDLGRHFLSKRLLKHFSRRKKQTTFVVIAAFRVNVVELPQWCSDWFENCRLDESEHDNRNR